MTNGGGALNGLTAGNADPGRGAHRQPVPRPALPHVRQPRAATWPTWPGESGFSGDFAEYLAQKFKTSTAADFAVLEAGVVSEETYVEQGLYWKAAHLPMLEYVASTYEPDLMLVGMPTTDEFQHQFLGLVSPRLPGGAPNPAYDDVDLNGVPDGRVAARGRSSGRRTRRPTRSSTRARELVGKDPTTFVSSDHGFAPQFLGDRREQAARRPGPAVAAADLELSARTGETIGKGEGVLGRRRGAGLPQRRRARSRPAVASSRSRSEVDATVAAIKAEYLGLSDPNDWTRDGRPEGGR